MGGEGFEPSQLSPYAPQAYVSASSTILPFKRNKKGKSQPLPLACITDDIFYHSALPKYGDGPGFSSLLQYLIMATAEELNKSGMEAYKQGKFTSAAQIYESALAIRPDYVPCLVNLSMTLIKVGRFDDAIHSAEKATELAPQAGAVKYHLGNALNAKGRWNEAVTAYVRAFELEKAQVSGLFLAGSLCLDHGLASKAMELWEKFLETAPADHPRRKETEEQVQFIRNKPKTIKRF